MNAFIIGGTGLIGYYASIELLNHGHNVKSIGLTPPPHGNIFAESVKYKQANIEELNDRELVTLMEGNDWLLYASSISANAVVKYPAVEYYRVHNLFTTERILKLANLAKIKKVVLLSNYYEYFNIEWPSLRLDKFNPYIKATYEQEISARKFNTTNFQVVVLELPKVFGIMPYRRPIDYDDIIEIYKSRRIFNHKGGTATMTVNQVAQAVVGAFEKGKGGKIYPLCGVNMSYAKINEIIKDAIGKERKIKNTIKFSVVIRAKQIIRSLQRQNLESGINPINILAFKEKNAFIDNKYASLLGVTADDVEKQITLSVKRALEIAKLKGDI